MELDTSASAWARLDLLCWHNYSINISPIWRAKKRRRSSRRRRSRRRMMAALVCCHSLDHQIFLLLLLCIFFCLVNIRLNRQTKAADQMRGELKKKTKKKTGHRPEVTRWERKREEVNKKMKKRSLAWPRFIISSSFSTPCCSCNFYFVLILIFTTTTTTTTEVLLSLLTRPTLFLKIAATKQKRHQNTTKKGERADHWTGRSFNAF